MKIIFFILISITCICCRNSKTSDSAPDTSAYTIHQDSTNKLFYVSYKLKYNYKAKSDSLDIYLKYEGNNEYVGIASGESVNADRFECKKDANKLINKHWLQVLKDRHIHELNDTIYEVGGYKVYKCFE